MKTIDTQSNRDREYVKLFADSDLTIKRKPLEQEIIAKEKLQEKSKEKELEEMSFTKSTISKTLKPI